MRIARRNWLLAGTWVVLLVLTWTLRGPGSQASGREVGRLFPDFQAAEVARVVLERSSAADAARSLELVRRDLREGDGEAQGEGEAVWVLPAHFDHPANAVTMRQLFDAVTSLSTLDLLAEDAASHGDYGVGAEGLTVRLMDAQGGLLAGFVQGADASTGTGMASYVRPLGADAVYRAPRVGPIPLDVLRWLDRQWVIFQPALVREVRVVQDGETRVWTRADMERWRLDGAAVSARLMRSLLDRLGALFFDEVVAARPEGRSPELEIILAMHDGSEQSLFFARPDDEGTRAAWRGADTPVVRFSAGTSALLAKSLRAIGGGQ